ncbi:MAG: PorT family protein [Dysgonamonadaceae bacterium]|jgi:hypothetical protein|nr:PorT family protein [Dysgonamonadaceae bacterium]
MKTNVILFHSLVAVFLSTAASTNAQVKFGIRGEAGANKITLNNEMLNESNYNSYKIGPTAEFMIPGINFGLEGSLLYGNDQTTVKEIVQGVESLSKAQVHYLDVPVNLKYKFLPISIFNIYISGGPYAHFKMGSSFLQDLQNSVEAKSFGTGLNFGAGIELFKRLSVGAGYSMKLTDDYSTEEPKWIEAFNRKKGHWTVNAAVYF